MPKAHARRAKRRAIAGDQDGAVDQMPSKSFECAALAAAAVNCVKTAGAPFPAALPLHFADDGTRSCYLRLSPGRPSHEHAFDASP